MNAEYKSDSDKLSMLADHLDKVDDETGCEVRTIQADLRRIAGILSDSDKCANCSNLLQDKLRLQCVIYDAMQFISPFSGAGAVLAESGINPMKPCPKCDT